MTSAQPLIPGVSAAVAPYQSLFDLTGKTIVVVGAGNGIGRESAYALAAHGARVIAADRDEGMAVEVAAELGNASVGRAVDLLKPGAADDFAGSLEHVDGLVFTPAINVRKRLEDYTDEEFNRVIGLNLEGSFRLIRAFAPRMAAAGGGSIVAFSSIRAATVEPGQGVYAASKAGLEMLLKTTAAEFGPQKVRANAIRPGVVETALTTQLRQNPDWNRAYAEKSALGRWAKPAEMTGAVVYLVSDASTFVTGSVVTVDGGWTAQDGRYAPPA